MTPAPKSKTNAVPAPSGERDAKNDYILAERPEADDEHEAELSADSSKLLIAGMADVRSGRVRRMDPNEFDEE